MCCMATTHHMVTTHCIGDNVLHGDWQQTMHHMATNNMSHGNNASHCMATMSGIVTRHCMATRHQMVTTPCIPTKNALHGDKQHIAWQQHDAWQQRVAWQQHIAWQQCVTWQQHDAWQQCIVVAAWQPCNATTRHMVMPPLQTDMQVAINATQCHNKNDAGADKFFSFKFLLVDLFSHFLFYKVLRSTLGSSRVHFIFPGCDAISVHIGKAG